MILPTIVTWMSLYTILGDDYIWEDYDELALEKPLEMRPANGKSIVTSSIPTLTWNSLYQHNMKTTESARKRVQRMVRKYHTPDWIVHYDLAPGMQLGLSLCIYRV